VTRNIDAMAYQINPSHSGAITFQSASLPTAPLWTVNVGGSPSYALIADGVVVVTVAINGNTQLIALNQTTGATAWGPIQIAGNANATYDQGTVFVLSNQGPGVNPGLMQAFDAATGTQKWTAELTGQYGFTSGPTALNGFVYTGGAGIGGTTYAVNEGTGAIAWTARVENGDDSTPVVTNDGVYFDYVCEQITDFEPTTGAIIWSHSGLCEGGGGGTAVSANGILYAPSSDGGQSDAGITLDAETGGALSSYVASYAPALGSQMGFFLQGGTLGGISLSSSTVQWTFTGDGMLDTSPILVNQYVFVGSSSGNLYALDAATGSQLWAQNLNAPLPAGAGFDAGIPLSGLSAGDGLLIVPAGNKVSAFLLSANP
jgi:outer membrane protein assembly factor BamB